MWFGKSIAVFLLIRDRYRLDAGFIAFAPAAVNTISNDADCRSVFFSRRSSIRPFMIFTKADANFHMLIG